MRETHNEPSEGAVKKRWEYVRKKATVIIPALVAGALAIALLGFVLKLALQRGTMTDFQFGVFMLAILLMVPCAVVIILSEKEALSIPYVPPVAEQVAALPAEEILVRGADPPVAMPEELLRAAQIGPTEPPDELLRAEDRKA